jgi:hypothetical protein
MGVTLAIVTAATICITRSKFVFQQDSVMVMCGFCGLQKLLFIGHDF